MFKIKLRWKRIGKFDYLTTYENTKGKFNIMYDTIGNDFFIHDAKTGEPIFTLSETEFTSWIYRGVY